MMGRRSYLEVLAMVGSSSVSLGDIEFSRDTDTDGTWAGTTQWIIENIERDSEKVIAGDVEEVTALRLLEDGPLTHKLQYEDRVEFDPDKDGWEYVGMVYLANGHDVVANQEESKYLIKPIVARGWPVEEWSSISVE